MAMNLPKVVFLVAAMMFFAVLALDITVPAVVLSIMALSNCIVLSWDMPMRGHRGEAA
jgi:hypothetical protein